MQYSEPFPTFDLRKELSSIKKILADHKMYLEKVKVNLSNLWSSIESNDEFMNDLSIKIDSLEKRLCEFPTEKEWKKIQTDVKKVLSYFQSDLFRQRTIEMQQKVLQNKILIDKSELEEIEEKEPESSSVQELVNLVKGEQNEEKGT